MPTLKAALELGGSAKNITSRYDGTALIAAAHLGHVRGGARADPAGAPLDHVNNLGWTALIESIVLGDGGKRHTDTLRRWWRRREPEHRRSPGRDAAQLARSRRYREMVALLEKAGGAR